MTFTTTIKIDNVITILLREFKRHLISYDN